MPNTKIDNEIIEEIKYRNDIEDVIASYVTLKRAGSNLVGLCPFHSEKTPSFTVFTATKNFYCFGCGAGGDVISFIMRAENLTYPDALRFLARRVGIALPEEYEESGGIKKQRILDMNREAAKYFHIQLINSPPAMQYLNERGLSMPLIRRFGLGYAPDSFGALTDLLKRSGYTYEEMKAGFLCGISEKTKRPYDYFRDRIMFPIIDVSGNIIAFGGRATPSNSSDRKYLNTSDTPAFKKSRNLYALNFARTHCAESLILCEGYMDVIALHGAGFENAVASLGTALTPEQSRLIKRYTKRVILCYDSDEAGQRASRKAFTLLREAGVEASLIKVTDAKDPDEFIKKFGAARFKTILESGRSEFEFRSDAIFAKYPSDTPEDKIKASEELTELLASLYSNVERDLYTRKTAERLGVPYESLKNDVTRRIKIQKKADNKEQLRLIHLKTEGYGDRINPDALKNKRAASAEEAIIGILLLYPELIPEFIALPEKPTPKDFVTSFGRKVYETLTSTDENGAFFNPSRLPELFDSGQVGRIERMKVSRMNITDNGIGELKECLKTLRDAAIKDEMPLEELLAKKRENIRNTAQKR